MKINDKLISEKVDYYIDEMLLENPMAYEILAKLKKLKALGKEATPEYEYWNKVLNKFK